jgi:penicillin-binding protein 2
MTIGKGRAILRKIPSASKEIHPDEIFIDSSNLPDFDINQFEGRLEKPISKKSLVFVGIFCAILGILYLSRVWVLQIDQGNAYETRSLDNTLNDSTIFAERGAITDRNGKLLAWNVPNIAINGSESTSSTGDDFSARAYSTTTGLAHLLGYVKYPQKDSSGNYYDNQYQGMSGVESFYNDILTSQNGTKITESDALGHVISQNILQPPVAGKNLVLSIDATLNSKLYDDMQGLATEKGFTGGAGALMDIKTGQILAMTSYPEYDPNVMSNPGGIDSQTGEKNASKIAAWSNDPSTPFLDRFINGLYAPGSTVKPYVALGVLDKGLISPDTQILSTGSISIPNPYDPTKSTVFKDWRAQGLVNMEQALAVSSDVYFYEVGGGYKNQPGLGIDNIDTYMNMFGFGKPVTAPFFSGIGNAGTIPSIAWKAANFPNDPTWRIGDTYHTAIGQYGFQVSPVQMLIGVGTIANDGVVPVPTILLNSDQNSLENTASASTSLNNAAEALPANWTRIPIAASDFEIVKAGMHMGVQSGVATAVNFPELDIAAKTGTAQVGIKNAFENSWIEGFFPYNNPQYAFVVMMEHGPITNLIGAPFIARDFLQWTADNHIDGI